MRYSVAWTKMSAHGRWWCSCQLTQFLLLVSMLVDCFGAMAYAAVG
jgi:hypothetical protein